MNKLSFSSLFREHGKRLSRLLVLLHTQFQTRLLPSNTLPLSKWYSIFALPCHLSDTFYIESDAPDLYSFLRIKTTAQKNMK